jgi:hypothetical protein
LEAVKQADLADRFLSSFVPGRFNLPPLWQK